MLIGCTTVEKHNCEDFISDWIVVKDGLCGETIKRKKICTKCEKTLEKDIRELEHILARNYSKKDYVFDYLTASFYDEILFEIGGNPTNVSDRILSTDVINKINEQTQPEGDRQKQDGIHGSIVNEVGHQLVSAVLGLAQAGLLVSDINVVVDMGMVGCKVAAGNTQGGLTMTDGQVHKLDHILSSIFLID
mgnify:CR=1 FL=1